MTLLCRDCHHEIKYIGTRTDGSPFYVHTDWRTAILCPCVCKRIDPFSEGS